MKKEIIFIFGRICSGKNYICEKMNKNKIFHVITVSDVLRKITKLEKRSDLLMTENLKDDIFKEMEKEIDKYDKIIINGPRQIEIVEYVIEKYKKDNIIQMFWINCDDNIRKERFEKRKSEKDDLTIENADTRDNEMGLQKILKKYGKKMTKIENSK